MITLDLDKNKTQMLLDLAKDLPELRKLKGFLRWDPHPVHANSNKDGFDLDIFVYSLAEDKKVKSANDVVYFKNQWNANKSIGIPVDNRVGGGDDEYVMLDIPNLPADRHRFEIFIFLFEAKERKQNFGMIANASFILADEETGEEKVKYNLTQSYSQETALHVGSLIREASGFVFKPQGGSSIQNPNEVLQYYV